MLSEMTKSIDNTDARIIREARRILRRLCESGAYLLVAPGLERAAVFRDGPGGNPNRIAVAERDVIHAFALKDWISGRRLGQLGRYEITAAGRAALKRILAEDEAARRRNAGEIEIETVFQSQHHEEGERWIMPEEGGSVRKLRFNMAESPWTALGRKRTQDGVPYLAAELVAAGERLREDFELAQMGPKVTQNWDRFLTACIHRGSNRAEAGEKAESARRRIGDAMAVMGPGLADVAFRCCCFLEGLETAEKRMGWAARSGKVVLKIALRRLADHYGDCDRGRLRRAG